MHAHHQRMRRRVDAERSAVRSGEHHSREASEVIETAWFVNSNFVVVQVDRELDGAAGHDELSAMSGRIAEQPQVLDKLAERPRGNVGQVEHSARWILEGRYPASNVCSSYNRRLD